MTDFPNIYSIYIHFRKTLIFLSSKHYTLPSNNRALLSINYQPHQIPYTTHAPGLQHYICIETQISQACTRHKTTSFGPTEQNKWLIWPHSKHTEQSTRVQMGRNIHFSCRLIAYLSLVDLLINMLNVCGLWSDTITQYYID